MENTAGYPDLPSKRKRIKEGRTESDGFQCDSGEKRFGGQGYFVFILCLPVGVLLILLLLFQKFFGHLTLAITVKLNASFVLTVFRIGVCIRKIIQNNKLPVERLQRKRYQKNEGGYLLQHKK